MGLCRKKGETQSHTWEQSRMMVKTRFLRRKFNQEEKPGNASAPQTETMKMLERRQNKRR